MKIREQIQSDMKEALKKKQEERLSALRLLQSAIKEKEIQQKPSALTEKDVFSLLRKQIKQYEEVVQELTNANRTDNLEAEITKIQYLKEYLPPALTKEEVTNIIQTAITELGAKSIKDQGIVIKAVQQKTNGMVDNVQVVQIVREKLQQL